MTRHIRKTWLIAFILVQFLGFPLPAQAEDGERQVEILPLVLSGADNHRFFTSTLSVMNLSTTSIEVAVAAFADGNGASIIEEANATGVAALVARTVLVLEPGEAIRRTLHPRIWASDLFPLRHAWLRLKSLDGGHFGASIRLTGLQATFNLDGSLDEVDVEQPAHSRRIQSDVQVDSVSPSHHFKAMVTWDGPQLCLLNSLSAYAVVNPSNEIAEVRFRFLEKVAPGNWVLHEAHRRIPPRTRLALFISNIFPELFPVPGSLALCRDGAVHESGVLDVRADQAIGVAALKVNMNTGHFVDLAVRVIEGPETDLN